VETELQGCYILHALCVPRSYLPRVNVPSVSHSATWARTPTGITPLLLISKGESIVEKIFDSLFDKEGASSRVDVKQDAPFCGLDGVIATLHGTKRLGLSQLRFGVCNEKLVLARLENLVLVETFRYDHVQALHFRT
jgi:hypothetical protein